MGVAVGIDLGTTNSCVSIVQGDQAKIVESIYGDRIHPSVICFHPSGEVLAGPKAKERLPIDPENTVYSFKRLLGQDIKAPEIQKLISHLPFNVVEKNGIPVLQTRNKEATLPEVSALMLRYLREMASETYGVEIKDAIITVPANFTDVQRASTKIAGRIAGFNVLRILNEPTAAALAYGFGGEREERIAVYDFGGGTFDITIIELLDDIFEVLSTAGDNFLGGDDFDEKIVFEMVTQFKKNHGFSISDNPVAMQRVRSVAERAKCSLSSITEVNATLRELATDKRGRKIDFSFSITRQRFEALSESLIERSLATCEEALELAKLKPSDLDNIVLVGGSTRIPFIRRKVEEFFHKKPRTDINPDEVVAIGAAINAFSLTGEALNPDIRPKKWTDSPNSAAPKPATSTQSPKSESTTIPSVSQSESPPIDPFSSQSPPLEHIDDPFAESSRGLQMNDPFARTKKERPSARPPRKIGKIDLNQRTNRDFHKKSISKNTFADLPTVKSSSSEKISDLPGLTSNQKNSSKGHTDLPALVTSLDSTKKGDEYNADLPIPKDYDNELDTWGEPSPSADSIDFDADLPIPVGLAGDRDLPVPAQHANDEDLPVPVGLAGDRDLPVPAQHANDEDLPIPMGPGGDRDLPVLAQHANDEDLPIPMGPGSDRDLPVPAPRANDGNIPIPMGITNDIELPIPDQQESTNTLSPAPSQNLETPLNIETGTEVPRKDVTEAFERKVAADDHNFTNTENVEAIDEFDFEEIDPAAPAPGSHFPPKPVTKPQRPVAPQPFSTSHSAQSPVENSPSSTAPDDAFGQIDAIPAYEIPASQQEMEEPLLPSYHPYHPLDEVVGDDGQHAPANEHEAFTVPIKKSTPAILLDVIPRGLGIATAGGYCDIIIERNAAIPLEQSRHFSTSRDNQTEVFIDVYQGEARRTEENTLLGRIEMRDIRPAPRAEISVLVTFEVDTDGILNVRAMNEETQAAQSTTIKLSGGLADDQVDALVEKYARNAK